MGEIFLTSALVGNLSQKLPIKNKALSPLKRPSTTKSKLLETKNVLIEKNIPREMHNEQPITKKQKKLLLEECQFVLDLPPSMSIKEKQLLRRKILDNGGTISYIVTRNSDIVISLGQEANSSKQKMARKYGVPVVMQSYIDKCIEQQQMLDTEEFLVSSKLQTDGFCKGKIIADSVTDSSLPSKPKAVPLASVTPHPWEELHGYTLVKAVLLKDRNIHEAGMNKRFHYYVLELHSSSGEKDTDSSKQFCVCTDEGYLDKELKGDIKSRKKQCYYLATVDDALSVYSQLYYLKTGQPHCMSEVNEILHQSLGTSEFQKLQLEWSTTLVHVDLKVLSFVFMIWNEALYHVSEFLEDNPEFIPLWKIDEAESILLQISTISSRHNWEDMAAKLSTEFYSILPHVSDHVQPIITKKILSQKQDLCQVLRDIVSVGEAFNWSSYGHFYAQYRALRCHIENLIPNTEEYEKIKQLLIDSQHHATGIQIQEIYRVHRYLEAAEFTHHLPNKQLLFHSTSPANLVGILSQGLNLPKVVVEQRGVDRFDIGMLGGGIYFTNSLSTCIKYSRKNEETGKRFLLVCEVALGNIYKTTKFDTSLTAPPDEFNSVHGVKATESVPSDFMDDEFVIYSPYQQCMHYLVEFSLPGESVVPYAMTDESLPESSESSDRDLNTYTLDMKDTDGNPKAKQMSRLQGKNAEETVDIPLKEVHVRAKLLDLVARVVVFQKYKNLNNLPLECKYVFPLERGAAVCGFEAYINKKHIVGKIKRKKVAHKEYKEAISKGHGAYLMDEESPDVFTVSIGNIPPLATVIIKITYILELPVNNEVISFSIPTSVAPWIERQAVSQVTQDATDSVAVQGGCKYSILISAEMPFPINAISSPTHEILMKWTETVAVVSVNDPQMDSSDGFLLLISLKEIHVPRMWTETDYSDYSEAQMLVFYPEFEVEQTCCNEIIIVLDASNSMQGDAFQSALQVVLLFLMEIPHECYFNIVAFGTVFQELFPASQEFNLSNMKKAKTFLKNIMPSFGNTELYHLLRYYNLTAGKTTKNVIIISDGHINNEGTVLRNAKMHSSKVRLFTCGISSMANKHTLCQIACWGSGAFEYMDPADKNKWKSKVKSQMNRAMQTALTNVRIEWQTSDNTDFLQAPQQIMSIFNGCRQVVYGFVPSCTMAKLVAVSDGKEYETVVSPSVGPYDTVLHALAARAVIRDWEDGLLAMDRVRNLAERKLQEEKIVELSKQYNLLTSITSFIAVEERDTFEEKADNEVLLTDLFDASDDRLSYIGFQSLAKGQTIYYDSASSKLKRRYDVEALPGGLPRQQLSGSLRSESSEKSDDEHILCRDVKHAPATGEPSDEEGGYLVSRSKVQSDEAPMDYRTTGELSDEEIDFLASQSNVQLDRAPINCTMTGESSDEEMDFLASQSKVQSVRAPIDYRMRDSEHLSCYMHSLANSNESARRLHFLGERLVSQRSSQSEEPEETYGDEAPVKTTPHPKRPLEYSATRSKEAACSGNLSTHVTMEVCENQENADDKPPQVPARRHYASLLIAQTNPKLHNRITADMRKKLGEYQQKSVFSPASNNKGSLFGTSPPLVTPLQSASFSVGHTLCSSAQPLVSEFHSTQDRSYSDKYSKSSSDSYSQNQKNDFTPFGTLTNSSLFGGVPSTLFQTQAEEQQLGMASSSVGTADSFPVDMSTKTSFGSDTSPLQISSITIKPGFTQLPPCPPISRHRILLPFENTSSTSGMEQLLSFAAGEAVNATAGFFPGPQNVSLAEDCNDQFRFMRSTVSHPERKLQSVGNVLTFLKDLLKCKGGLPLCNAVNRHVRDIARKNDRYDVIKLMDGTMKLSDWLQKQTGDISQQNSHYMNPEIKEIFETITEKIKTNGYCEELDCLRLYIMKPFASILEDNGLNCYGIKAAQDIKRMLATLAAIMYLTHWILTVAEEKVSGRHDFQKLENLSHLLALILMDNILDMAPFLVATQFVRKVESNHPLVYKSLNCGNNWEEFIIDYVEEPPSPPSRLSWKELVSSPEASACYIATT